MLASSIFVLCNIYSFWVCTCIIFHCILFGCIDCQPAYCQQQRSLLLPVLALWLVTVAAAFFAPLEAKQLHWVFIFPLLLLLLLLLFSLSNSLHLLFALHTFSLPSLVKNCTECPFSVCFYCYYSTILHCCALVVVLAARCCCWLFLLFCCLLMWNALAIWGHIEAK